jgi:hypothetical protein
MMKKYMTLAVVLLAMLSFAGSKFKAYVGYDKDVDLSKIKTFDYYETLDTSVMDTAPPVHEMIKLLIIKRFQDAGMKRVTEDPDIYVTYHTNEHEGMRMNVTMYHYSYGTGWWWSPYWGSGMDISSYTRGTLVVDAWDPDTEGLVWRGAVMGVVPENPNPEKAQKTIEKALNAIGKEWRKHYKKNK